MNRRILRLAIPNIISNITIPLLGMVDLAIAGHLDENSAIAGITIGTTIFNMIYWLCAFLRMGTSGVTAQAYGAGDKKECANILVRGLFTALCLAVILLVFRKPIGNLASLMTGTSDTAVSLAVEYFRARIWAAPASLSLFALNGWFIGVQNSKTPMVVAIISNIVNVLVSILFVFVWDWGFSGIGWATVVAQYTGLLITVVFWLVKYRSYIPYADIRASLRKSDMLRFFNLNRDIFIRTLCLVSAYTFFTYASGQSGDIVLSTNALLMQLFTLYSYMSDGFAYAAESLTGMYVGAKNKLRLKESVKKLFVWAIALTVIYVTVYIFYWDNILSMFTDTPEILDNAHKYVIWAIAVPVAGCAPFLMDGIMLGATQTKILRNTMLVAIVIFYVIYYLTVNIFGNNAIWLAFLSFIAVRGVLIFFATDKLNIDKLMTGRELYST